VEAEPQEESAAVRELLRRVSQMMRLAVAALIRTQEALEALAAQQVEQEVGEVLPERMRVVLATHHRSAEHR